MDPSRAVVDELRGAVLTDAAATLHVLAPAQPSLVDYYLRFDPSGWLQVRGDKVGWGLELSLAAPPESFDMGQYGQVIVSSTRDASPFAEVIGRHLTGAAWIRLPGPDAPVGLKLAFRDRSVLLFTWGDELFAADELPDVLAAEDARIEPFGWGDV